MAKGLKSLGDILLGIVSFGLSYWFYRGHLEQYVHYIAHYGFYFQVLLNIVMGKPLCSHHEPTNVYSSRAPLPFTVK